SDLSRESLERVVDEATALARVTSEDPHAGLPDAGELIERVPDLELEDHEGPEPTPEEKIELARRAEAAALATDSRITNSEGAEYFDRRARYAYATSHGFARGYSTSSFGLTVAPVAASQGEMQRDAWYTYARRRRALEDPESVGRTAAARALRRLGAGQGEAERGPRHLRSRHGGEPAAFDRRRRQRAEPLPACLVPARAARHARGRAGGDDRGRRAVAGRSRLETLRR